MKEIYYRKLSFRHFSAVRAEVVNQVNWSRKLQMEAMNGYIEPRRQIGHHKELQNMKWKGMK